VGAPEQRAPVEALREAARVEVEATSLRRAAAQIGMSATGLRGFLEGTDPYLKTERKLRRWLLHRGSRGGPTEALTAETAGAALSLLLEHLPPRHRTTAASEVLDVLDRHCRQSHTPLPSWVERIRPEVATG
jgi:hypothetical protein